MVAKKRNTLRNRAAAAAAANVTTHETGENEKGDGGLDFTSRSFLHQPRESKKDKQLNKQKVFLNRVIEKASGQDPSFAGISKSAVRRRKRKIREDLKPKMGDLLTSLGQEDDLKQHVHSDSDSEREPKKISITKVVSKDAIGSNEPGFVRIRKNEPNIRNQRGAKVLSIRETFRMNDILTNTEYQQDPFRALKDVIKTRL